MKSIKIIILSLIAILNFSNLICQINNLGSCFWLSDKFWVEDVHETKDTSINPSLKYRKILENILMQNLKDDYIIKFITVPAFDSEYAFQIIKDTNDYKISAIVLHENLWYFLMDSHKADSMKVRLYERTIDETFALKIDSLFKIFIDQVPEKRIFRGRGLDGETYQFHRQENGIVKCGETWSPYEKSILGELVSICDLIMEYSIGKDIDIGNISKRIDELIENYVDALYADSIRPKNDYEVYRDLINTYKDNFNKILNDNLKEDYIIRFSVQPKFDAESAFQIKQIDSLHFEVSSIILHENLWEFLFYSHEVDSMQVSLYNKSITNDIVLKLHKLFPNTFKGRDSCTDVGSFTYCFRKQINSASNVDFPLWKLAYICEFIMEYAIGKDIDMENISKRIDELIEKVE